MLDFPPFSPLYAALLSVSVTIIWQIVQSIAAAFKPGLRSIPGPLLARFSPVYRAWHISKGKAPDFYLKLHRHYGEIVRTGPKTVDISDPKALPIIYGINSRFLKSSFYDTMSPFYMGTVMQSMFTVRDPSQHQALRRPVAQKFSMSSIKCLEPYADECTGIFIQAMKDLEGQTIDLGLWLQWYAFDVIGAITFQHRFGFMEKRQDINNMVGDIEMVLKYAAVVGQLPALHPWLMGNPWMPALLAAQPFFRIGDPLRTIVQFTQDCIDEYDREPGSKNAERPDFLAWLRGEEAKGRPISNRDMINHLSNNLIAGSDTTSISLRAVIYLVLQHPEVYRKLKQEIDDADRAGKLSDYVKYAECLDLPYLQAVMKEAMRCHPGVSFPLERVVPEGGTVLCGIPLDAGTVVGINPVVMHHNKQIFGDDAGAFRPERWTESSAEHIKVMDRHLLTFGAGSRTCIGKNISIMEMGKLIPQLIRHFDIIWAAEEPEWRVETYWFAKQHGMKCQLISRTR